jgi:hypothetical protein
VKTCFKCGESKPYKAFYRHPQMADGHLGKCKDCTKADVRRYWAENADTLKQIDGLRKRLQRDARYAPNNAVRDGRMAKPSVCHYCGEGSGLEAHHWNYYRPLDVTWLCKRCHRIADMARRDAEEKALVLYLEKAS